MQLQGNITSIQPTGGYQSQQGYIYTFNMGIQTPNGAYMGEIGSKSQNYPAKIGDAITVETKQDQYGMKFKKINPQFAKPQQQTQQQFQPQQPQQPQAQQAKPNNAYAEELSKWRGIALSYCIDSSKLNYQLNADTYKLAENIAIWIMTGVIPQMPVPQGETQEVDDDLKF